MSNSRRLQSIAVALVGTFLFANVGWAQSLRDDIGWTQLRAEIGAGLEDGSGIIVSQVEAREEDDVTGAIAYLPDASNGNFSGTTIYDGSGFNTGFTGHAPSVGLRLYGTSSTGISGGVSDITGFDASDWLNRVTGLSNGGDPLAQVNGTGQTFDVQNHSYISNGNGDVVATDVLERVDFLVNRDNTTIVVGANNGAGNATPELLAHGYNSITVGRSDGNHSRGATRFNGEGRYKPEIVAPQGATSFSTPLVAGAASILRQAGAGTNAVQNETVKAILLAGATKNEAEFGNAFNQPSNPNQPLHEVYGVGELNVYNSYKILQGGEQTGSVASPVIISNNQGFDYEENLDSGDSLYYNFDLNHGANEVSVALTWNLLVDDLNASTDVFDAETTLNDLDLFFYDSTGSFLGTLLDSSISTVDNVEHLFLTDLDAGLYTLEVARKSGFTGDQDFAVAFTIAVPEPGSALVLIIGTMGIALRRRRRA